ncbi:integral membrane protein [Streptomyces laurentii]|uniref:Integral membrane protein n=1 Tax=Streptomyces laurentii TaxID=39478 RepID=A0A169NJI7_STRLU|nr:integral membrane protein [Streptomyces laurentii]
MAAMQLTRTHRILIGLVVAGALIIAGIGFAGSYAAVRELALAKGFGTFSYFFPIGIDAGICVLLALDLLLTWLRIPFPLLRQTAWVLTAATIAFNGAAAWPDPLGVGMHAVIPVLFVVAVEAARHAVGRIADITADKHMEGVRLTRWLLSPVPTFRLWRRMKLWELRSYDEVIKLEQDRLIYQARLQARFGRAWRRKAPVEALMPLRLAKYGVPLADTAGAGLAAAGVEPVLLPAAPETSATPELTAAPVAAVAAVAPAAPAAPAPVTQAAPVAQADPAGAMAAMTAGQERLQAPVQGQAPAQAQQVQAQQVQPPVQGPQQPQAPVMMPGQQQADPAQAPQPMPMPVPVGVPLEAGPVPENFQVQEEIQFPERIQGQVQGQVQGQDAAGNPWFPRGMMQKPYQGGYDPAAPEALDQQGRPVQQPEQAFQAPQAAAQAEPGQEAVREPMHEPEPEQQAKSDFIDAVRSTLRTYAEEYDAFPGDELLVELLTERYGPQDPRRIALLGRITPRLREDVERQLKAIATP